MAYLRRSYWGVNITTFHHVLRAPWPWFSRAFRHGNLFGRGQCQEVGDMVLGPSHDDREEVVYKTGEDEMTLGPAPRELYPLVVCFLKDSEAGDSDSSDDVRCLVSIVHLRDDQCPVPSQVEYKKHVKICQKVKIKIFLLFTIRQIFE